jgi:hypothetical protein
MPQGPFQTVSLAVANRRSLNITANTVVKPTPGFVVRVSVVVAGSAAGTINDAATVAAAVTANVIAAIPATVGTYSIEFPATSGIVIKPGSGQTIAVSFN